VPRRRTFAAGIHALRFGPRLRPAVAACGCGLRFGPAVAALRLRPCGCGPAVAAIKAPGASRGTPGGGSSAGAVHACLLLDLHRRAAWWAVWLSYPESPGSRPGL